jgi:hypothetical protein
MYKSRALPAFLIALLALATALGCKNPIAPDGTPGDASARLSAVPAGGAGGTLELFLGGGDGKGHTFVKDDFVAWGHHDRFSHHGRGWGRHGGHRKHFPLGGQDVTSVWITILSIEAHRQGSGWTTVFSDPQGSEYDLLELAEDVEFLSSTKLTSGRYTQLRLVLGSGNRVTVDGSRDYPLMVPSGEHSGIKIISGFFIKKDTATTVVLDFDPEHSLMLIGRGRFLLKPVIRIEEVSYESKASDNQPPSVSFPPTGYQVSGAADTTVDGNYAETSSFGNFPLYSQSGGSYLLFNYFAGTDPDIYRRWQLNTTTPAMGSPPALNTIPYYGPADPISPEGTYTAGSAASPGPTVLRMPISGNTLAGNTLTAHYIFSDPEGDGNASTFQWYRFTNSTDTTGGTAILGATSFEYTTVNPDDSFRWLRIEVTPIDSRGAVGTPALSDPLLVTSSS